jgi:putative Flp pilus-assembly TadE/G-like protein
MLRRQDGQIVPLLMVIMLSLLAFGVLFFQVGRAAIFSTEAQTAADAAALAAVEDIKAQLTAQVSATGTSDLADLDPARIRAAAERYARKNKGTVIKLERRGVDVKVWANTLEKLGNDARRIDSERTRGVARARARLDVFAIAQPGGGTGNIGSSGGGGIERIKDDDWKDLGKDISKPPTCGNDAKSNDLVTLGKLLKEHGFAVGENAEMGDDPRIGVHAEGGFHYKCRHSGALDVNADNGPGTEKQIIDGIVGEVQKLGFRTIWQAAGHFDHIHIDVANSGAIGVGGGSGGAVGALEETGLDVKLIDWACSAGTGPGSPTARTPTRAWPGPSAACSTT